MKSRSGLDYNHQQSFQQNPLPLMLRISIPVCEPQPFLRASVLAALFKSEKFTCYSSVGALLYALLIQ